LTNRQLDEEDILRERKNLFYHCNMLTRRFNYCSIPLKLQLFKSFCVSFYDAALWTDITVGSVDKLRSSYVKCINIIFRYSKFYSVSSVLAELGLYNLHCVHEKRNPRRRRRRRRSLFMQQQLKYTEITAADKVNE